MLTTLVFCALLSTVIFSPAVKCLTADQMFPFGPDNGDLAEYRNDDGFVQVNLNINFPFFGNGHNVLFVDTNGDLTFDAGLSTFTPNAFPLSDGVKMVAPFWSDVDTLNNNGLVYYRQSTDPTLLQTASAEIKNYVGGMNTYSATWMFIATWYNVTFFGGNIGSPTNTFQCVLVTDGVYSYAIYNYLKITWTTGIASGGNSSGLGGIPAQVGFDAGDGINFYAIPQSRTPDVVYIGSMSNLNPPLPGRYIFQINNKDIHPIPPETIETCFASTDPHFTTFDGGYYSPQEPPGPQFLAAAPTSIPNDTLPWAVWFRTSYWDPTDTATCITSVEIDICGQVITFGMNGFFRVNGLNVIAPYYYPSWNDTQFTVVTYGITGHLLTTVDQVKISFTGTNDNTLRIQAPLEIYGNIMQGVCGNMDGNPWNDITCPTGQSIDLCWERHHRTTTARPPTTPSGQTTAPTKPPTTTTQFGCSAQEQQQIDQQCSIITDPNGPFADCVLNASSIAMNYYQSCIYDLCINSSNPNTICYELQAYADACMQAAPTIVLNWRSQNLCPPNCSANAQYVDCASSCPATCGNPNAPITCPIPCKGDCTCNNGYLLDVGQCILPTQCGCTDTSGLYHQYGDDWITSDCQYNCTCGDGHTITCMQMPSCAPDATCQVEGGERYCFCNQGFTGDGYDYCNPIDYCAGDPCANGATCVSQNLTFHCHCPPGYTGHTCNVQLPTTAPPPPPPTTTEQRTTPTTTKMAPTTPPPLPTTREQRTSPTTTKKAPTTPPPVVTTTRKPVSPTTGATFDCNGMTNKNCADPNNPCGGYYFECSNGIPYKFPCSPTLVFNPATCQCDYPKNVPGCNSHTPLYVGNLQCCSVPDHP